MIIFANATSRGIYNHNVVTSSFKSVEVWTLPSLKLLQIGDVAVLDISASTIEQDGSSAKRIPSAETTGLLIINKKAIFFNGLVSQMYSLMYIFTYICSQQILLLLGSFYSVNAGNCLQWHGCMLCSLLDVVDMKYALPTLWGENRKIENHQSWTGIDFPVDKITIKCLG